MNITIKVLQGFDGMNGQVIDMVTRKAKRVGKGYNRRYQVSYGGKQHLVFVLPSSYGDLAGSCINVEAR